MINIKEYSMVKDKMGRKKKIRICFFMVAVLFSIIFTACDNGNETHIHQWGDWILTNPANCIAEGVKTRVCSSCSESETQAVAIDTNTHVWGAWAITTHPA
jgi:hypothetical protein